MFRSDIQMLNMTFHCVQEISAYCNESRRRHSYSQIWIYIFSQIYK